MTQHAAAQEPLLELKEATRRFGGLVAVNGVSVEVMRGELFGLIGPNGAGKTTLFNLITGLTPFSSGSLIFEGRDVTNVAPHRMAELGVSRTFQNLRLWSELSVLENVRIATHLHGRAGLLAGVFRLPWVRKEEKMLLAEAQELLELAQLGRYANDRAGRLSYGDQRRLEIVRALAVRPKLLLLDEPAAGMNPSEKQALSEFIRLIKERFSLTIVLIEHHVPIVMGLCDRIVVINFGSQIALGTPATVQADPAVIEAYLGGA